MGINDNYSYYHRFVEKFLPLGFRDIDRSDPLVIEMEKITEANNQYFFVADLIQIKIYFSSLKCLKMIGVPPESIDPAVFFISTHPDDLRRHNLARTKLFNLAHEMYIEKTSHAYISTNLRLKNPNGEFINTLLQGYLIHAYTPYESVFYMQIMTDISWFTKIRHGYHYYIGDDPGYFRYPDEQLLMTGNTFSDREFEILELISRGMSSGQIAGKLFLSVHTINTHRRNILKKSGKQSTSELVLDLKARGIL